ncbi:MAG: DedA family protein [Planctomycetota bacterium]
MEQWFTELFSAHGVVILYFLTVFVLILCGMGVPISEEIVFLAVGFAAHSLSVTHVEVALLCVVGVIGIMAGDSIPFFVGRRYGADFLTKSFFRRYLTPRKLETTRNFFRKHGAKTVFFVRFLAGLRMPTFFLAGTMGVSYWRFFFFDLMGALISCPVSIILVYAFGSVVRDWLAQSKIILFIVLSLVAVFVIYHYWKSGRNNSNDG